MAGLAFRSAPVRVRAPATSGNLGPAFDSAGLALGWYNDLVVRVVPSGLRVDLAGEGVDALPRDEDNLVVRALRAAFTALGGQPPGMEIICANRIPHERGLGASAAAICAGMVAARALTTSSADGRLSDEVILRLATELEGHPDNVASCLHGGFTVAWTEAGGPQSVSLDPASQITPIVCVPATPVTSATARMMLPATVPHSDAVANAARASLLVMALTTRPDLLFAATADWLHQQYRSVVMPDTVTLIDRLRQQGVPAVISGAGPSVLVLATGNAAAAVAQAVENDWEVRRPGIDTSGATILSVD